MVLKTPVGSCSSTLKKHQRHAWDESVLLGDGADLGMEHLLNIKRTQHPHDGSLSSVAPVLRDLMSSFGLCEHLQAHGAHTYTRQNAHTHKIKFNYRFKRNKRSVLFRISSSY